MPDPLQARADAMRWLGAISGFAHEGLSASEAMQHLRDRIEADGGTLSFGGYQEAARLFGQMTAVRHASERFAAAPPSDAITWEHVGQLPYGQQPAMHGGPRTFDVRVFYSAMRSGQEVQDYVTLRYTGSLPPTVGELQQEALDVTSSLVEGYGASFGDITSIEIGEL